MPEEKKIQIVEQAYTTLKNIADLNIHITGSYFELIISKEDGIQQEYADEIINRLFWKFCKELFSKQNSIPKAIIYHSFTLNNPSDSLLKDCHQIIRSIIEEKKKNTETLYSLLKPLSTKYPKNEVEKVLDTLFDILLSYYIAQERNS